MATIHQFPGMSEILDSDENDVEIEYPRGHGPDEGTPIGEAAKLGKLHVLPTESVRASRDVAALLKSAAKEADKVSATTAIVLMSGEDGTTIRMFVCGDGRLHALGLLEVAKLDFLSGFTAAAPEPLSS